ncbi:MAG: ATP-binding cassette domain-containing protein [Proteobacteria bacterium]|nr:ATP-binding cassette domain-containing protein [Pseudomonadota bacterium]
MIRLVDVTKQFLDPQGRPRVAVDRVNLDVLGGETLALVGTSGCGKTTTLKLINRLVEPTSGVIAVDGTDIRQRDIIELRRCIGYVIQAGGLFPHMTVGRNVALLCELESWDAGRRDRRVRELLELVGLAPSEFAQRFPRELSGGQRQRVGLARALALDPPYVLMDEPFGALDPVTRHQIHEQFLELKERVRKTIIVVTHDLSEAFRLADRVAVMDGGRLLQVGTEEDLRERPADRFVRDFLRERQP